MSAIDITLKDSVQRSSRRPPAAGRSFPAYSFARVAALAPSIHGYAYAIGESGDSGGTITCGVSGIGLQWAGPRVTSTWIHTIQPMAAHCRLHWVSRCISQS